MDIGTGTSSGIWGIRKSRITYKATALVRRPREFEEYLGNDNVRSTSAEMLHGFTPESVGGFFSVLSLCYSFAPRNTVHRLDEVLIPGGLIKARFQNLGSFMTYQSHTPFTQAWKDLGYDVIVAYYDNQERHKNTVVLALKPGGVNPQSAQELLKKDYRTYKSTNLVNYRSS